jgi:hypothetical protein
MSNYLAVATVTETLRYMLQTEVNKAVSGAIVEAHRPEATPIAGKDAAAINIYLYQVLPNAAWRNQPYEARTQAGGTRSKDDTVARQRLVPINLHYLFSFYGNEKELEPQRLLGVALTTLEANSRLDPATIRSQRESYAYLRRPDVKPDEDSFLDEQVRRIQGVTLTALALNLEELSKLWSVFFQVPYALSVAYEASVVLLDVGSAVKPPLVRHEPQIGTVMGEPDTWEKGIAEQTARLEAEGKAKDEKRKAEEAKAAAANGEPEPDKPLPPDAPPPGRTGRKAKP